VIGPETILDQFSLKGKSALVTGSSRGLGAAIAVAFAEAGTWEPVEHLARFLYAEKAAGSGDWPCCMK